MKQGQFKIICFLKRFVLINEKKSCCKRKIISVDAWLGVVAGLNGYGSSSDRLS